MPPGPSFYRKGGACAGFVSFTRAALLSGPLARPSRLASISLRRYLRNSKWWKQRLSRHGWHAVESLFEWGCRYELRRSIVLQLPGFLWPWTRLISSIVRNSVSKCLQCKSKNELSTLESYKTVGKGNRGSGDAMVTFVVGRSVLLVLQPVFKRPKPLSMTIDIWKYQKWPRASLAAALLFFDEVKASLWRRCFAYSNPLLISWRFDNRMQCENIMEM